MVVNLTWVSFKELFVENFMPDCQTLCEGMNFVQTNHTRPFKAYGYNLNIQMNDILKMDELFKKCIVFGGISKRAVDALFKFPKFVLDIVGIIKIVEIMKIDDPKRNQAMYPNKMREAK